MAVPKRKMSRSNTRHRRAGWEAAPVELVEITVEDVRVAVPRRLAKASAGYLRPVR